ncbi:MRA1 NEP1 like pre-rRNA adjacent protein [Cryptosporidium ubiquitum]|uniref:MRA1 NEP1 like pre-rRNA adjacent protein n=1 Tax=Cryptosporidium ubiquitum TaxID=857276 RepID=A0A1J4MDP8_9CRYT|nr:MRA1 NEP1 like pre-rRNA adjacent protein [Cryptosporidium ubiquitum]OII72111.1 MRA1 NEP1 like pre-rRNA adjacent protein [Cryptosporidium ubiquitum]
MDLLTKRNKVRKQPSTSSKFTSFRTSIILIDASLFVNKKGGKKELLTEEKILEEDVKLIANNEVRPDIIHNSLLMLLDSPLCKSGSLTDILILNSDGKLIRVNPKFRVPRSFKIFSKIFSEFLSSPNGELRLPDGENTVLITLLNDSIEDYFSNSEIVIGLSREAKKVSFRKFIKDEIARKIGNGAESISFVIGASAMNNSCGQFISKFTHYISLSDISIPSYICCTKICGEMEELLGIY